MFDITVCLHEAADVCQLTHHFSKAAARYKIFHCCIITSSDTFQSSVTAALSLGDAFERDPMMLLEMFDPPRQALKLQISEGFSKSLCLCCHQRATNSHRVCLCLLKPLKQSILNHRV